LSKNGLSQDCILKNFQQAQIPLELYLIIPRKISELYMELFFWQNDRKGEQSGGELTSRQVSNNKSELSFIGVDFILYDWKPNKIPCACRSYKGCGVKRGTLRYAFNYFG